MAEVDQEQGASREPSPATCGVREPADAVFALRESFSTTTSLILTHAHAREVVSALNAEGWTISRAAPEMLHALQACQSALAMLTEPNAIRGSSVLHAWAQCVAAEAGARSAIAKALGPEAASPAERPVRGPGMQSKASEA